MYAESILAMKHVKAKVCLVGEVGVGKTSLVRRFVTDTFDDKYIPTVGTKVSKKSVEIDWRGKPTMLDMTVWDIMGEKGFRTLLKDAYFHGAQGILAVCDMTIPDSLFDLNNWVNVAIKQAGDIPFCFIGNKSDLCDDIRVEEGELAQLSTVHEAPYYITSAKSGENVDAAFISLSKQVVEHCSSKQT